MKKSSPTLIQGPWTGQDGPVPSHLEEAALEIYHDLIVLRQKVYRLGLPKTTKLLKQAEACLKESIISAYLQNRQEEDQLFAQNLPK